jgi:hypothetical protein
LVGGKFQHSLVEHELAQIGKLGIQGHGEVSLAELLPRFDLSASRFLVEMLNVLAVLERKFLRKVSERLGVEQSEACSGKKSQTRSCPDLGCGY